MRSQSAGVVSSLLAQDTNDVYLVLLTLLDGAGVPFRFTSDAADTLYGGDTYIAFPFDITLPNNVEDKISTAQLSITNVDRRLIDSIRDQTTAFQVQIDVILASSQDLMVSYTDFTWRQLTYDAMTITGTLTLEDFLNEQVGHIMTAKDFPGLFYL